MSAAPNEKAAGMLETSGAAQETTQHRESTPDPLLVGITVRKITNAGHAVQQGQNGDFMVSRWGTCRYCADLAALQAFARQIGAAS